jgi:hypothetical protein
MPGRRFGVVLVVQVPGSYHALPTAEQERPGKVMADLAQKYAGKVDLLRRYWTSAFTTEATDVLIIECDDLMQAHSFQQDMTSSLAEGGDPDRFGMVVDIYVGVNPDADS